MEPPPPPAVGRRVTIVAADSQPGHDAVLAHPRNLRPLSQPTAGHMQTSEYQWNRVHTSTQLIRESLLTRTNPTAVSAAQQQSRGREVKLNGDWSPDSSSYSHSCGGVAKESSVGRDLLARSYRGGYAPACTILLRPYHRVIVLVACRPRQSKQLSSGINVWTLCRPVWGG